MIKELAKGALFLVIMSGCAIITFLVVTVLPAIVEVAK